MLGIVRVRFQKSDNVQDIEVLVFRYSGLADPWSQHALDKAQRITYLDFAAHHPELTILKTELYHDVRKQWAEFNQGGFIPSV